MIVDSVMSRRVVSVRPHATIREAASLLALHRVGCLVALEHGAPVGIVTERDLVSRVLAPGRDPDRTLVTEIMTAPVATVEAWAAVEEAAARMKQLGVKRLVVVKDGQVLGILSVRDIAYAQPAMHRQLIEGWVKTRWQD